MNGAVTSVILLLHVRSVAWFSRTDAQLVTGSATSGSHVQQEQQGVEITGKLSGIPTVCRNIRKAQYPHHHLHHLAIWADRAAANPEQ
jgi:hypothetical protein